MQEGTAAFSNNMCSATAAAGCSAYILRHHMHSLALHSLSRLSPMPFVLLVLLHFRNQPSAILVLLCFRNQPLVLLCFRNHS